MLDPVLKLSCHPWKEVSQSQFATTNQALVFFQGPDILKQYRMAATCGKCHKTPTMYKCINHLNCKWTTPMIMFLILWMFSDPNLSPQHSPNFLKNLISFTRNWPLISFLTKPACWNIQNCIASSAQKKLSLQLSEWRPVHHLWIQTAVGRTERHWVLVMPGGLNELVSGRRCWLNTGALLWQSPSSI